METDHLTSHTSTIPEEPCPDKNGAAIAEIESRPGATVDHAPLPPLLTGVDGTGTSTGGSVVGSVSPAYSHHSSSNSAHSTCGGSSVRSVRAGVTTTTTIRKSTAKTKHSGGYSVGSGGRTENSLDLDGFDVLRFRSKFLQTVEELKMRREADVKKEKRIRELMEEKHQLQQKCDEVESCYSQHLEQCSHQEQEVRKQFTSQIRHLQEDKARQVCLEETRHKEIKALKDEIRALQLSKYNLEKKVEDQGRQLEVGSLSRESILREMSGVEAKYQTVLGQVAATSSQMTLLEANVKEAVEMSRKLRYVNEHQRCLLADVETELESARLDLVRARGSSVADRLSDSRGDREQLSGRKTTAQELKMTIELNKQLQAQLSGVRRDHQAALDQLKEAHTLLDKHIETSNRAQENEKKLREEVEKLREEKERLDVDLVTLKEELTSQRQELTNGVEDWKAKAGDVEGRLRRLQEDYSELQRACDELETERNNCEHSLRSEIETLLREREKSEEEMDRGWQGKVEKLEESLREIETQHRVKNLEDKDVQVSTVPSAAISSPKTPLQLKPHHAHSTSSGSPLTGRPSPNESATPECMIVGVIESMAVGTTSATTEPIAAETKSMSTESIVMGTKSVTPEKTKSAHREVVKPSNNETNGVPSPPALSPEVISESRSTSPAAEDPVMPPTPVGLPLLALPSPRLHLERVQLPLKMVYVAEEGDASQSSKDVPTVKRRFDKQQHVNLTTTSSNDTDSPAKKQKLLPQNDSVVTGKSIAQQDTANSETKTIETELQSQRQLNSSSFAPLSQPSSVSYRIDHERESLSLSQSATDTRCKKGKTIPWRIELPQSFYASKNNCPSTDTTVKEKTGDVSPSDGKITTPIQNVILTASASCQNPPTPCGMTDQSPAGSKMKNYSLQNAPPNTPLVDQPLLHPTLQHTATPSSVCPEPSADQSVPHSPGGSGNFAIVFSEGEEEGEDEVTTKDNLLSSQMNRQIQKVTSFLKTDRLRRTKVPKL